MTSFTAAADDFHRQLRPFLRSVELMRIASAETEPAPVSVVLIRVLGTVHRAARIEGIPGLMFYAACSIDDAGPFDLLHDLSAVRDEAELDTACFGPLDDKEASEIPTEGPITAKVTITSEDAAREDY